MTTGYPGALDDLDEGTRPGLTHGDVADAIEAIQATLGVDPQGAQTTVAGRLAALEGLAPAAGIFGDGADGAVVLDPAVSDGITIRGSLAFQHFGTATSFTLMRDVYATDLTVLAGVSLKLQGYRLFVSGTLTNHGVIHSNGANAADRFAGNGASGFVLGGGGTGGSGPAANTAGNGGLGGTGSGGTAAGGSGGTGGGSGSTQTGGVGAGVGAADLAQVPRTPDAAMAAPVTLWTGSALGRMTGGTGGGGGGGQVNCTAGGGGGGGGIVLVAAKTLVNNGAIQANGGAGAGATGTGVGAGGGGGGGGGVMLLITRASSGAGAVTASGGLGGAGFGAGATGTNGADGSVVRMVT